MGWPIVRLLTRYTDGLSKKQAVRENGPANRKVRICVWPIVQLLTRYTDGLSNREEVQETGPANRKVMIRVGQ